MHPSPNATLPGVVDPPDATDIAQIICRILKRADEPLSASRISQQLSGPWRMPTDQLKPVLAELVANRVIFRTGRYRNTDQFWHSDGRTYARRRIEAELAISPCVRTELKKRIKGVAESIRTEVLAEMLSEGRVVLLPRMAGKRTQRLSTKPADPRDYAADIEQVLRKLAKSKFSRLPPDFVYQAARCQLQREADRASINTENSDARKASPPHEPSSQHTGQAPPERPVQSASAPASATAAAAGTDQIASLADTIMSRLTVVEPRAAQGAMVSLVELRQSVDMQCSTPGQFDRAIWQLVAARRLEIHRLDDLSMASSDRRDQMVYDEQQRCYHAVSRSMT